MKQPAEIRGSGGDRSSPKDRFELLLHDLQQELGPHAGLTSSPDRLQQIMREYISNEKGWDEYAFRDDAMTFTRNLVDRGNGSYNLVQNLSQLLHSGPNHVETSSFSSGHLGERVQYTITLTHTVS